MVNDIYVLKVVHNMYFNGYNVFNIINNTNMYVT